MIPGFVVDLSDEAQMESLLLLASVCSKCASSENSSVDESTCMQLLLGFPSVIIPLAHFNKV
jgi:U3 small nucleolar RNA-associated protein 10